MLEPEVVKGLSAAAAVTLALVVFLVAVEVLYRRVAAALEARRRAGKAGVAVHELLERAARRTDHVLAEPAPYVIQKELDSYSVTYELRTSTRRADRMPAIRSELRQNVLDAFGEAGVEILSPRYSAVRNGNTSTVPRRSVEGDRSEPSG